MCPRSLSTSGGSFGRSSRDLACLCCSRATPPLQIPIPGRTQYVRSLRRCRQPTRCSASTRIEFEDRSVLSRFFWVAYIDLVEMSNDPRADPRLLDAWAKNVTIVSSTTAIVMQARDNAGVQAMRRRWKVLIGTAVALLVLASILLVSQLRTTSYTSLQTALRTLGAIVRDDGPGSQPFLGGTDHRLIVNDVGIDVFEYRTTEPTPDGARAPICRQVTHDTRERRYRDRVLAHNRIP
jgi:hypothetical protein